jgi:hypothetical protein
MRPPLLLLLPPLLLLLLLLVLAVPSTLAYNPRDYTDCESCVAVGYGWSITKEKCGGFKNKQCAKPKRVDDSLQAFTEPTSSVAEKLAAKRAHEAARASLAEQQAAQQDPQPAPPREQTPEELQREAYLYRLAMMVIGVFVLTIFVCYLIRGLCAVCRRKGAGIPMDAATVKLDVRKILFVQASIDDKFRDGRTVQSMIDELTAGSLSAANIPAIRVVRKHGCYFTLDHRRLYALRQGLGSNKKLADRTVTCILESFKDEEIVKEFKRKATTENPTGISVNSLWMADWKPFVEATPEIRKFRSADADDSDVDILTIVGGGRTHKIGTSPKRKSPKAALDAARQTALSKKFDEASSSSSASSSEEEDEEEEEDEDEEEEDQEIEPQPQPEPEPEPEGAKAPKGFTPKFAEPTVNEAAAGAKPAKPLTNYESAFARFEQIDKDGDGKITVEELVTLGMTEEQARHEIEAHDTDGDGSVSWSEYLQKKKQDSLAKAGPKHDVHAGEGGSHAAEQHKVVAGAARVHDDLSFKGAVLEGTDAEDTQ